MDDIIPVLIQNLFQTLMRKMEWTTGLKDVLDSPVIIVLENIFINEPDCRLKGASEMIIDRILISTRSLNKCNGVLNGV